MTAGRSHYNDLNQQKAIDVLRFFCRHLVALCVTYQQIDDVVSAGDARFFACPGTIICIRGICHFLTAGHTLQEWDTLLRQKKVTVHSAVLADIFGPDATSEEPIPFAFLNERKFYIHDEGEGLDFGLIALRPYYVRLLAKHGIKAIFEENWIHQHRVEFHGYTMLGLPEEFITSIREGSGSNSRLLGTVSPTMIGLRRLDEPPEDIRKTKNPRFIGQLHPDLPLTSIVGMSGGPIFGFNYGPPMRYWIVAIQSAWLPSRRITFGCPLPVLAELLTHWTDQLISAGQFVSINDTQDDNKGA